MDALQPEAQGSWSPQVYANDTGPYVASIMYCKHAQSPNNEMLRNT
jgi:hypothetical protein